MRRFLMLATLALLAVPQLSYALSLDAAKAQGLVGERADGYLGAVATTPDATALVREINNKRRAEYERIATQNGQPRSVIEKLAAEKAYARTPAGQYLQGADGSWQKK